MASVPEPHPDAELIRICAEHVIARDAVDQAEDITDDHPLWAACECTQKVICDAKPQTIDGVLAKPWAAKAIGTDPNGGEDPAGCMAEVWAWAMVNDLVRIGGRVTMARIVHFIRDEDCASRTFPRPREDVSPSALTTPHTTLGV